MIFRSRKKDDEKVRMSVEASSLFVPIGESFATADAREAARIIRDDGPAALVFIPSLDVLSSPRPWVSAISSASFVVVIGDGSLAPYRAFMRLIDNVIYSPVPRRLSAAFITGSRERAMELISGASSSIGRTITVNTVLAR